MQRNAGKTVRNIFPMNGLLRPREPLLDGKLAQVFATTIAPFFATTVLKHAERPQHDLVPVRLANGLFRAREQEVCGYSA